MATLNHKNTTPSDGWIYFQPETGSNFEGMISDELVERVVAHRQWKNLPRATTAEAWEDVQRQICARQKPGVCTAEPGEDYVPHTDNFRALTSETVMAASRAAIAWLQSDEEPVPEEEVARRAAICRQCPYNKNTSCACTPVFKLIDAVVPKSTTTDGLAICSICMCSLKAKTRSPKSVIEASNAGRNLQFPDYCWQIIK